MAPARAESEDEGAAAAQRPSLLPFEASAALETGGFFGHQVRRQSGMLVTPTIRLAPRLEAGAFRAELPVLLRHRQAVGTSLSESRGELGLEGRWAGGPGKLRLEVQAAVVGVWRPGWPDLYQPLAGGGNEPTDRYSHLDGRAGLQLAAVPFRHHHARLKYRFTAARYAWDPDYDSVFSPMHLAPFDSDRHEVSASWRYLGSGWKLGAVASAWQSTSRHRFARDAGSALTHSSPGGLPSNPLRLLRGVEPGLEAEWKSKVLHLEVSASFGYELSIDTYQGYYTYGGVHPRLKLEYQPDERVYLALRGELRLREYGPQGYQAGLNGHPPLAWGKYRADHRFAVGLDGRFVLRPELELTLSLDWVRRETNFPAYVPGSYPVNGLYDIDWNYMNWTAGLGVVWRLGS